MPIAAFGCGADDGRIDVYPVTGKVLVSGKPAEGVSVIFYPQSPAPKGQTMPVPAGVTDPNGEFRLTSYETDDGAPVGEYLVALVWDEERPPDFSGVFEPKDRFRGKYADPDTSQLTATVEEGGGEIDPFELP